MKSKLLLICACLCILAGLGMIVYLAGYGFYGYLGQALYYWIPMLILVAGVEMLLRVRRRI